MSTIIAKRTIKDFFTDGEYQEYAKYVIEHRAIPSIIDGLKPGARKIVHAALKTLKPNTTQKFLNLVGATLRESNYHHGDASLVSTIMTLAQPYKDTLHPLRIEGSGGELRAPESAAPRYLEIGLSKYSDLYRQDMNILEYNYDGEEKIEPKYYLPLIPLALTKRTSGIAIGYAYNSSISYNPADLIDACLDVLNTGDVKTQITPYIEEFEGEFNQYPERIYALGKFKINKDSIDVYELPPNETLASFEKNLSKLMVDDKIIDFDITKTKDDKTNYKIFVNPSELSKIVSKDRHYRLFKLGEWLRKPTFTFLDENGKVAIFETEDEVIKYFTEFRLGMYDKLKASKIADLEQRIQWQSHLIKFIDMYLNGEIKLDKDTPIADVKKILDKNKLPHTVLDLRIAKLTKEEYDKLCKNRDELLSELEYVKNTTTKQMYVNDLTEAKKSFSKDFPAQEFKIIEE